MKHIKLFEDFIKESSSEEAYSIHSITGNGQDKVQNFIDDNDIDGKKLADWIKSQIHRNPKERYDLRDIINGTGIGANKSTVKKFIKQFIKESVDSNTAEISEMSHKDVHFKDIMKMYKEGGSFTKKKVAAAVCKDPKVSQKQIEATLEDCDYDEIVAIEDELGITESKLHEYSKKIIDYSDTKTKILVGLKTNLLRDMKERYDFQEDGDSIYFFNKKGHHFGTLFDVGTRYQELKHDGSINDYGWLKESQDITMTKDSDGLVGNPGEDPRMLDIRAFRGSAKDLTSFIDDKAKESKK